MKKTVKNAVVILISVLGLYSCSKDSDDSKPVDTDEYFSDSSGQYVVQLGDEGYNVFKDGSPYESADLSNRGVSNRGLNTLAGYQYNYRGICILPPQWPRRNNNPPLGSFPVKPTTPSKKTISCNLKAIGGGYKVTPKPRFLGGSSYECYECLFSAVQSDEFFVAVCNGTISIGGSISLEPAFESVKQTLSGIAFDPNQTAQFVQGITSTGQYICTKR